MIVDYSVPYLESNQAGSDLVIEVTITHTKSRIILKFNYKAP